MIDAGTIRLAEFAHATVVAHSGTHDGETTVADFMIDRHMLASTILYTLLGGRGANDQPLDFDEFLDLTETGFDDPRLFDHVKAARLELADLLQAMVDPDKPLEELFSRPFYWYYGAPVPRLYSALRLTSVSL